MVKVKVASPLASVVPVARTGSPGILRMTVMGSSGGAPVSFASTTVPTMPEVGLRVTFFSAARVGVATAASPMIVAATKARRAPKRTVRTFLHWLGGGGKISPVLSAWQPGKDPLFYARDKNVCSILLGCGRVRRTPRPLLLVAPRGCEHDRRADRPGAGAGLPGDGTGRPRQPLRGDGVRAGGAGAWAEARHRVRTDGQGEVPTAAVPR